MHVPADYERFTAIVGTLLPASRVRIYNDGEVALAAATGGREGIVVVAGTGSIAYGADRSGRHLRCGGWGYIRLDEVTHRRFSRWLQIGGVALLASLLGVGWLLS